MTTGTMKWFNAQKGFGFIAPDDGGSDAFVHIGAVERLGIGDLREGSEGGLRACLRPQERQDVGPQPQGSRLIATSVAVEFHEPAGGQHRLIESTTDVLAA